MNPRWSWRRPRRPERRHRSGKPRRSWFQLPELRLPSLPKHASDTGTFPAAERRQRRFKRFLIALAINIRFSIVLILALATGAALTGTGLVLARDWGNNPDQVPVQTAPNPAQLGRSLQLGQRFITALYKALPNREAVQSESSGVPLSVTFPAENNARVLLGQPAPVQGRGSSYSASSITDVNTDATHDRYTVTFSSQAQPEAVKVRVVINWTYTKTSWQLQLRPIQLKERAGLWLDQQPLTTFNPGGTAGYTHVFPDRNQSLLRTLRFTIRHATQEAYLYWRTYGHDPTRAAALGRFLQANGYQPGFDLRAPLYLKNLGHLPDDMPVNAAAYPDCRHIARSTEFAYAYHSKVCVNEPLYVLTGERDPLLQAWSALTILEKYHNANRPLPENHFWIQGSTPAEVATHLQGMWDDGIPKCTPFNCAERSGIRTAVFCALETQLGYRYASQLSPKAAAEARHFADAAAKLLIQTQIGPNGNIRTDTGVTYTRPGQAGSFLESWVMRSLRFTTPSIPVVPVAIALFFSGTSPTPLEYNGPLASNSETTLDVQSALANFDCAKYNICR